MVIFYPSDFCEALFLTTSRGLSVMWLSTNKLSHFLRTIDGVYAFPCAFAAFAAFGISQLPPREEYSMRKVHFCKHLYGFILFSEPEPTKFEPSIS